MQGYAFFFVLKNYPLGHHKQASHFILNKIPWINTYLPKNSRLEIQLAVYFLSRAVRSFISEKLEVTCLGHFSKAFLEFSFHGNILGLDLFLVWEVLPHLHLQTRTEGNTPSPQWLHWVRELNRTGQIIKFIPYQSGASFAWNLLIAKLSLVKHSWYVHSVCEYLKWHTQWHFKT